MPLLIAFTGKAGAGKSTAAEFYSNGYRFFPESFAERPKTAMMNLFGLEHSQVFGNKEQKEAIIPHLSSSVPVSGRLILQTFCTEWARHTISPDVWIWPVANKWDQLKNVPGFKGMVISDLRFDNEAEWIKSQGGIVIEIVTVEDRNAAKQPYPGFMGDGHVSESGIGRQYIDICITNPKKSKDEFKWHLAQSIDLLLYHKGWHDLSPHPMATKYENNLSRAEVQNLADLIIAGKNETAVVLPEFIEMGKYSAETSYVRNSDLVEMTTLIRAIAEEPISGLPVSIRDLIVEWADEVFPNRTISNALQKMVMHEIPEYLMKQDDEMELADLGILIYDIANLAGYDLDKAIRKKMEINKKRTWQIDDKTGLMSHVKEDRKFVDLRDLSPNFSPVEEE